MLGRLLRLLGAALFVKIIPGLVILVLVFRLGGLCLDWILFVRALELGRPLLRGLVLGFIFGLILFAGSVSKIRDIKAYSIYASSSSS